MSVEELQAHGGDDLRSSTLNHGTLVSHLLMAPSIATKDGSTGKCWGVAQRYVGRLWNIERQCGWTTTEGGSLGEGSFFWGRLGAARTERNTAAFIRNRPSRLLRVPPSKHFIDLDYLIFPGLPGPSGIRNQFNSLLILGVC